MGHTCEMNIPLPTGEVVFMTPKQKEIAIKWYHARDTLFGHYGIEQNLPLGVELAKQCIHDARGSRSLEILDDAVWVVNTVGPFLQRFGPDVRTSIEIPSDILDLVLRDSRNNSMFIEDPRALYFCGLLKDQGYSSVSSDWISLAASLGYVPAMFHSFGVNDFVESSENRQKATQDRNGIYFLAKWFEEQRIRDVWESGKELSLALFKEASDLGHLGASVSYITMTYNTFNAKRYQLLGEIARCSNRAISKFFHLPLKLDRFCEYTIGSVCNSNFKRIDKNSTVLFGHKCDDIDGQCVRVEQCCVLYDVCCRRCKRSVVCWTLVGKRLLVVKDIRRVIAKLLWEQRFSWFPRQNF